MLIQKKSLYYRTFRTVIVGITTTLAIFMLRAHLTTPTPLTPQLPTIDVHYLGLADDMQQYKTTNTQHHSGDLYEHSVWVAHAIEQWFHDRHFWTEGIDRSLLKALTIAGFLHDIGKGGDLEDRYYQKPNHPEVGFNYLRGAQVYHMHSDGRQFDFDAWFKHECIDDEERALIAVLTGIHWDFGNLIMRDVQKGTYSFAQACTLFLTKLGNLAALAHYNNGHIDLTLVRAAILIGAADIKGASYVPCPCDEQCSIPDCTAPHPSNNMYREFNYDTVGKASRQKLLDYAQANGYLAD